MKQKITSLVIALSFLHTQLTYALPVKNNASNGVQFNKNQNTLNITAPDKSVINYDSFNIAANEAVNFVQPGASSSVLNRVLSGGASTINGALAANGNVLLVNSSGVMFGGGATVNANSFIASTKNITDANFQAGLLKFEGSTSGTIVNNGLINSSTNVGLIAANIENKGTIKACKNAGLIAGNTGSVSVDFDGDGLINFTADSSTIGSGTIENSGTIKAGQVLLTANDVSNVLENVINNTGTIEATKAVAGENGAIQLISDASVKNTGNLKAPEGKITIATGGDMNSEGTISAVDGEVDIDATGDVTSSGTLEAGKLTEKGATFGISGTFSVDESSLKNDDNAIEFTGDTTLTGNISDVDNIIVGGGVTLTLAADVTLTAGADTSSNTNVNDSSNIVPSTGGDFIWMADDAVIDGAGFNLTFDTKGTNSWLTSINGVNDLTFLNGNTDKVSNTVTYELKKDITTTGIFTIGEGTSLQLYPIDITGAAISDIKLTADNFAVGGIGENAGSIKLNDKSLTLEATSITSNSTVNFYVNDQANDFVYSVGSLKFLGDENTKFNVGVANNDIASGNTIMVKGINIGGEGKVANIELDDSIDELSASAFLPGGDLVMHGNSKVTFNNSGTLTGSSIQMDSASVVDANGHNLILFTTGNGVTSSVGALQQVENLSFYGRGYGDVSNFVLSKDVVVPGSFLIGDNTYLSFNPADDIGNSVSSITLTADHFISDGAGATIGSLYLNDANLTLDATSATTDSSVSFYVNNETDNRIDSTGSLTFLGNENTSFLVETANDIGAEYFSLVANGINIGNDSGEVANVRTGGSIDNISALGGAGGDVVLNGSSSLSMTGDFRPRYITGESILMDNASSLGASLLYLNSTDITKTSIISNLSNGSVLDFNGPGDFIFTKNLSADWYIFLRDGAIAHLQPTDVNGLEIDNISFSTGFSFGCYDGAGFNLNNKNVTFSQGSGGRPLNFLINDLENNAVISTGSLTFFSNNEVVIGVVGTDSVNDNKIIVNTITLGDNTGQQAILSLSSAISELSSAAYLTIYGDSKITFATDTLINANAIHMSENATIDATAHSLTLNATQEASSSGIGNLLNVTDLFFYGNTVGAVNRYNLMKDVNVAGTFTVGDNVALFLNPQGISDINLTASNFIANGTGATAGSIILNDKNLTLDATSITSDSAVNIYVTNQYTNKAYSTGSLTFLGDKNTKFNLGVSNHDDVNNMIEVCGIDMGNNAGRVANIELVDTVWSLNSTGGTFADFNMYDSSMLTVNDDANIYALNFFMDDASVMNANGYDFNLISIKDNIHSVITNITGANNLGFIRSGSATQTHYDLKKDITTTGRLYIGDMAVLHTDALDPSGDIKLTSSHFAAGGTGNETGSFYLGDDNLTLDATSTTIDSFVNLYVNAKANESIISNGSLTFLGNENTKFVMSVSSDDATTNYADGSTQVKLDVSGIDLGNNEGRVASLDFYKAFKEISTLYGVGGDFAMHGGSQIVRTPYDAYGKTPSATGFEIYANSILMDNDAHISNRSVLYFYDMDTTTDSVISNLDYISTLGFFGAGDYVFTKDISAGFFVLQGGGVFHLDPRDATGAEIDNISLRAGAFVENAYASINLNNKNVFFQESASMGLSSGLNFYVNDSVNNAVTSTGSLTFVASDKFNIGVVGNDPASGSKIIVSEINIGDSQGNVADIYMDGSVADMMIGNDLTIYGDSRLILHNDTVINANAIHMSENATIDATSHTLTFNATQEASSSGIGNLLNVTDLSFYGNTVGAANRYNLMKDVNVAGTFTVGDNVALFLNPQGIFDINLTASNFIANGTGATAGSIILNDKNLILDATSTEVDSDVNIYITDQVYDNAYSNGSLTLLGNENTKFNLGVSNYDDYDNMIQVYGIDMGSAAGRVANINLADTIGHFTATGGSFADFNMYGSSTLTANANTRVYGRNFFMDDASVMNANGYNFDLTATDGTLHSVVTNVIGANDLAFLKGGTATQTYFDLRRDITNAGTFTVGDSAVLVLDSEDGSGNSVDDFQFKAAKFAVGGAGELAGSIMLNNKNLTLTATEDRENSYVNFYINDQLTNTAYSSGSLKFVGQPNSTFIVGVANNDTPNDNTIEVNGIELGHYEEIDFGFGNPYIIRKTANLRLEGSISKFSANGDTGGDLILRNGPESGVGFSSCLFFDAPTTISARNILMEEKTSMQGNSVTFNSTDTNGESFLNYILGFTDISFDSPSTYNFKKNIYTTGIFSVADDVKLVLAPDEYNAYPDTMTIRASSYTFADNASIDLNNINFYLQSSSTVADSFVNFCVNDQLNDTVYSTGFLNISSKEGTKFIIGVANNDSMNNKIEVKGIELGQDFSHGEIELESSISEFSATADGGGNFVMNNASKLTLNADTNIAGNSIVMDAASSIDANLHNLTLYASGNSTLGTFTNLNDFTLVDNVVDGSQIQYDLLSNTINARNVNLGADVKLRGDTALTTISAENLHMMSNSQINSWQSTPEQGDVVLNISNNAVLGEIFFIDDFTLTGGGTFTLGSWQQDWNLGGKFTLGENTTLVSNSQFTLTAWDSILMSIGSAINVNYDNNLILKTVNSSTLYDINTGNGALTLEGIGSSPTSYDENGNIVCSNNNTPTYINAN